jgi:hypothetical protein
MARKFVVSIDLLQNELLNARIQNVGQAPSAPVEGQIYYNNTVGNKTMYFYNGEEWIPTSGSVEVITDTIGQYVKGGTGLTATYSDSTGETTLDLDNTAVTAASYGSQTKIPTFTVDQQGRLTAASEVDVATELSIAGDTGTDTVDLLTDTLTVSGGEGIDVAVTDNTITISAEDATSSNKGVASFDSTDFTVTSGNVTLNEDRIEDIVSDLIVDGTGLNKSYDDSNASFTLSIDDTVVTRDDQQTLTNKVLGTNIDLGADLDAQNYKIVNVGTPTASTDAANKAYVDAVAEGLHVHEAAKVYVAANIDLSTALQPGDLVDGVTLATGDRVLVNGQTTTSQNGIYVVNASGAPSRALDFDSPLEVKSGDFIFVSSGTNYGNTGWVQTLSTVTIGTSPISFTQFSGAGTYLAGEGLVITGTEFKVGQGTGIVVNANDVAIDTAVVARKYTTTIGNGVLTSITVAHNLQNQWATVQVFEGVNQVEADVSLTSANSVTIGFAVPPTQDQYRVVITA